MQHMPPATPSQAQAAMNTSSSKEAVAGGGGEGQPLATSPAPYPSLGIKKPPSLPIEMTLSHQESSIHAEWLQHAASLQELGSSGSDHVQLSMGEALPLPAASAKGGQGGEQKKAAAAVPLGGDEPQEPACCRGTLASGVLYWRMVAWLALLFAGYGFQRGLCAGGLPYDCKAMNAADVYAALTSLAFAGGALGWLVGVTRPARFSWLATPRCAYLWLAYAVMLPAYSAISSIPAMHRSLASVSGWGTPPIVVISLVVVLLLAAVAFHIWLATYPVHGTGSGGSRNWGAAAAVTPNFPSHSSQSRSDLVTEGSLSMFDEKLSSGGSVASGISRGSGSPRTVATKTKRRLRLIPKKRQQPLCFKTLRLYLLPRAAVLLYFIAWFAALAGSGSFKLHLHHYALGWAVASLAAFNHPVSGLLLALGTAVFVQGASSYGFDPFFMPVGNSTGGCLNVASPNSGQMTCAFWADKPFNVSFCSDSNWIPWFDCTVDWPWPATKITKKMIHMGNLSLPVPQALMPLTPLGSLIAG